MEDLNKIRSLENLGEAFKSLGHKNFENALKRTKVSKVKSLFKLLGYRVEQAKNNQQVTELILKAVDEKFGGNGKAAEETVSEEVTTTSDPSVMKVIPQKTTQEGRIFEPDVNIDSLTPHSENIRIYGTEIMNLEMLKSIEKDGVLTPLLVTPDFVIVSGHQRWRICKKLGIETVDVFVDPRLTNELDILEAVITSNQQRQKTPVQILHEIEGMREVVFQRGLEKKSEGGKKGKKKDEVPVPQANNRAQQSRDIIGEKIGVSGSVVQQYLYISDRIEKLKKDGKKEAVTELENMLSSSAKKIKQVFNTARNSDPEYLKKKYLEYLKKWAPESLKNISPNNLKRLGEEYTEVSGLVEYLRDHSPIDYGKLKDGECTKDKLEEICERVQSERGYHEPGSVEKVLNLIIKRYEQVLAGKKKPTDDDKGFLSWLNTERDKAITSHK